MSILRKFEPRNRAIDVRRTAPLSRSMEDFYRHEMGYGKLVRAVVLPFEVDHDKIRAELKEGILTVTLPKIRVAERHTVKVA